MPAPHLKVQKSWKSIRRSLAWGRWILIGLALVVFLFPLLWTLLASLGVVPYDTSTPPVWSWPPTFENFFYIGVAEPGFLSELATSLSISLMATLLAILTGFLAAYSLARSSSGKARTATQLFLVLASMPVMAYILPLSDTVRRLHLYDTFTGVSLANAAVFAPLGIYVLYGYLRQVPTDLEDAAQLDGANLAQVIWRVTAPAALPGIVSTAIILFVLNWNLLLIPLVLTENHVRTIPVAMSDFFTFERDLQWPVAAAVLITSLMPLIALVAAAHRAVERFALNPENQGDGGN